ncbi:MAG: ABC transporter ATP-binding protein [Actinobacteria bacterium]|nr:MAG: ABC transporter ATP-binding protein [Actinomycetota bacterium]
METVVAVSCLKHVFEDGTVVEMCGLDFEVQRGDRVAVLGPNGSGKSTLLFHLLGLLRPEEGTVRVLGVDPAREFASVRERIGVVLQNVEEQIVAPTVREDVSFSLRQYGRPAEEVEDRTRRALEMLGIAHLADRVPHHLSGGEKRKVALAGALALDPVLLVLDEPLEGLDPKARSATVSLLNDYCARSGCTLILTTHDINSVAEVADRVYVMAAGGGMVMKGSPADVFSETQRLASSNIEPPILADLFSRLEEKTGASLPPALTVREAVEALLEWKEEKPAERAAAREEASG